MSKLLTRVEQKKLIKLRRELHYLLIG